MPGFVDDYTYEELYRVRLTRWVSDALISPFCERICSHFKNVRYIGVLSRTARRARGSKDPLPDNIKTKLTVVALDEYAEVAVMPVNFSNAHWTVVMMFKSRDEIVYFDSMGAASIVKTLDDVAHDIAALMLELTSKTYAVKSINSPRQFDSFSCGIFVCQKIARMVDNTVSNDMGDSGLNNFRFRLIAYVLHGEKV
jgi:hypothetical protein